MTRYKIAKAQKYFNDISKIKLMECLKYYVFNLRRNKKLIKYRSTMKWAKNVQMKALFSLVANTKYRKLKKVQMA